MPPHPAGGSRVLTVRTISRRPSPAQEPTVRARLAERTRRSRVPLIASRLLPRANSLLSESFQERHFEESGMNEQASTPPPRAAFAAKQSPLGAVDKASGPHPTKAAVRSGRGGAATCGESSSPPT